MRTLYHSGQGESGARRPIGVIVVRVQLSSLRDHSGLGFFQGVEVARAVPLTAKLDSRMELLGFFAPVNATDASGAIAIRSTSILEVLRVGN